MIRRPPRSTLDRSSAASDVYKRQDEQAVAEQPTDEEQTAAAEPFELPDAARRNPDLVGVLTTDNGGYRDDQWGNVDGRFASTLMRDIKAPVASRWAQILLRRVLLTQA